MESTFPRRWRAPAADVAGVRPKVPRAPRWPTATLGNTHRRRGHSRTSVPVAGGPLNGHGGLLGPPPRGWMGRRQMTLASFGNWPLSEHSSPLDAASAAPNRVKGPPRLPRPATGSPGSRTVVSTRTSSPVSCTGRPVQRTHVNAGTIRAAYSSQGGENGGLGYPMTNGFASGAGVSQDHLGGRIPWSGASGGAIATSGARATSATRTGPQSAVRAKRPDVRPVLNRFPVIRAAARGPAGRPHSRGGPAVNSRTAPREGVPGDTAPAWTRRPPALSSDFP